MKNITVRIDRKSKTIDIFGGQSPFTRDRPYLIDFHRVHEPDWFWVISQKPWWCHTANSALSEALHTVRLETKQTTNR